MGAQQFHSMALGKTASEAFNNAREEALDEYGHRGYTGTIAEKHSFTIIWRPAGVTVAALMSDCLNDDEHFCQDKWGAAACVQDDNPAIWHFFGWASS